MHVYLPEIPHHCIDHLVQNCSNAIASALELLQSCAKPSMMWVEKENPDSECTVRVLNVNRRTALLTLAPPSPQPF